MYARDNETKKALSNRSYGPVHPSIHQSIPYDVPVPVATVQVDALVVGACAEKSVGGQEIDHGQNKRTSDLGCCELSRYCKPRSYKDHHASRDN